MNEYQGEKRDNAVNFIELNLMTAQTIDLIDPDGNTDTQRLKLTYSKFHNALTNYNLVPLQKHKMLYREYQDVVKNLLQKPATTLHY